MHIYGLFYITDAVLTASLNWHTCSIIFLWSISGYAPHLPVFSRCPGVITLTCGCHCCRWHPHISPCCVCVCVFEWKDRILASPEQVHTDPEPSVQGSSERCRCCQGVGRWYTYYVKTKAIVAAYGSVKPQWQLLWLLFSSQSVINPHCSWWAVYMHTCVYVPTTGAVTCVPDCHGEGQCSGLELHRDQEGCNCLMAAKSQPAHCCCSVYVLLLQTRLLRRPVSLGWGGVLSRLVTGLSLALFSTSLKSLQSSPAERQSRLTETDRQAHEFLA